MSRILNEVLSRAKLSPFYKERLKHVSNFNEAPVTYKADLRTGYPFGFLATAKNRIASYHESSGTEGNPIASFFSEKDWEDVTSRFLRSAVTLQKEDTFLIKTPYSMVTTAHQAQRAGESMGSLIVPGDNRTGNMPYSRVVQLIRDLPVTVTWSLPNEVVLWAHAARANGLDPATDFPHLRAFWVAGEALSPARKQLLSDMWGGKAVFEDYGSTETGSLAGECAQGRQHAWSDRIHFEVYSSRDNQISDFGQGQLLVTPIFREAMPLVRYLIEDEVELSPSPCDCGSSLPLIEILGRRTSQVTIGDQSFFPKQIEQEICDAGRPFSLSLWKASYGPSDLEVEFYAETGTESCAHAIEEKLRTRLGFQSKAIAKPLETFIDPFLFKQKIEFAKPSYIVRRPTC